MKKYSLIYADPAWSYRDKCNSGERGANHKYDLMSLTELKRLPVWDLSDDNCLLAMWWVPPMPIEALQVMEAWGFRLHNMCGFTWAKTYPKQTDKHAIGMGHMTRANTENMLFAVKGKMLPRIELFARENVEGWHAWGNECDSNVILQSASAHEAFISEKFHLMLQGNKHAEIDTPKTTGVESITPVTA